MIKDCISNSKTYYGISERVKQGLEWLQTTDLKALQDGKYIISGDEIYANVQSYITKDSALYEAHKKYIDIQCIIFGEEKIGVAPYKKCITSEEYDSARDIEFLECKNNSFWYETLKEGEFLILFPHDAHKPSIKIDENLQVRKIVVKVAV